MADFLSRHKIGHWGERVAAQYLRRHHYLVIEKNYRKPFGEIDVIAVKDQRYIFCEVKTKRANHYLPQEQVTPAKQRRMLRTIEVYLKERRLWGEVDFQIDVVAIVVCGNRARIYHIPNCVERAA